MNTLISSEHEVLGMQPTGALEEARAAVSAKLAKNGEVFPEDFINVLQLQPPRNS